MANPADNGGPKLRPGKFERRTWFCDLCGQVRPRAAIVVVKVPVDEAMRAAPPDRAVMGWNMKVCRDSIWCVLAAQEKRGRRPIMAKVGDVVVWVHVGGRRQNAIVLAVWREAQDAKHPALNLMAADLDPQAQANAKGSAPIVEGETIPHRSVFEGKEIQANDWWVYPHEIEEPEQLERKAEAKGKGDGRG